MPIAYLGKKTEAGLQLDQSPDLIAVRTRSGRSVTRVAGGVHAAHSAELDDGVLVAAYPEAGVEVYRMPTGRGMRSLTDRKIALRTSPDVRFAGGVLVDAVAKDPVLYTENLFVKFIDAVDPEVCTATLREAGLTIKNKVDYATNAYFVEAPEGTGQKVFDIANQLLARKEVEYSHPELIRPRARKTIFTQQWHLKKTTLDGLVVDAHANIDAAHEITRGEGTAIAIIDDGIDIDHPELSGSGKILAPQDATLQTNDPRPKDPFGTGPDDGENHGTACAGVACANGVAGASGVAPKARLIPIRLSSGLGSQREAEAFKWAADNGADVISCSWGPADGRWYNPNDPKHNQVVPLPASTRLAIDYAVTKGRGGKGCVVLFAAGNGNESVENDGYASYDKVIAVAACNDRGTRSVYSDFGNAVWCAFPSSDIGHAPFSHPAPLTAGIWTTDRIAGDGYNTGSNGDGDIQGSFTKSFGGTSSACPGAAGVAALVLSINPDLKWYEVKEILKQACDKIDPQGGNYAATGHSPKYGYGRLNALTAVRLATPQLKSSTTISRNFDAPVPDMQTVTFDLNVPDTMPVDSLTVDVNLRHTYIGDLVITLNPPATTGVNPIVLHNRAGGSTHDLNKTYNIDDTPVLGGFIGKNCNGIWTLQIQDVAAEDSGTLVSFGLELEFVHPDRILRGSINVPVSPAAKVAKRVVKKKVKK